MAYFLLAFKIKMLTPAICLLVIWSPNLWGTVWTYLSDCWYSFISFRPWQTWSSPTWSPTSHVPVNWPCAVRCAPTPPAERRNPSSPTRSSHRNSRHILMQQGYLWRSSRPSSKKLHSNAQAHTTSPTRVSVNQEMPPRKDQMVSANVFPHTHLL